MVNTNGPAAHKNKIAFIGNPNVGKSTLFNRITSSYSLVANAPYTTMEVARADVVIDGIGYEIIDAPGIMSLDVQSEDGLVARNMLMREHPELIVFCVETSNLPRSLQLLAQVAELDIPLVLCLNFMDEAQQKGIAVDRAGLESFLGVPVVETVATEGHGVRELTKAIGRAAVIENVRVHYPPAIDEGLDALDDCLPEGVVLPDALLLLLLYGDPEITAFVRSRFGDAVSDCAAAQVLRTRSRAGRDIARIALELRTRWADDVARRFVRVQISRGDRLGTWLGRMARHPVWGWCILAGMVYVTYVLVGRIAADVLVGGFEQYVFDPLNGWLAALIPWPWLEDFLLGPYGLLTTGLENAVGTVLPILTMFFLILNVLEDTGYIPNLSVLTNRLLQRVGLSGKAILPLVLGFGCKTMATLATRILDSRKERMIAIFLIAFAIPCSSQLGVNLAILSQFPLSAFVLVVGVLVGVEVIAGLLLNRYLPQDTHTTDFIMELPPIRMPAWRALCVKTYYRLKWFLIEAVPLFVAGALILYAFEITGVLALIKATVFPIVVTWLDLPIETVDAFLLCIARHEAGAVILLDLVRSGQMDYTQTVVSVIIVTCFVPCFANIMAMIKELGMKQALVMVLVIITVSVMIGGVVNWVLRM